MLEYPNVQIDWEQGCVFVQDGTIYCSPNLQRPVVIPPEPGHVVSPFEGKRLNAAMFKQPVWWSDVFGWLSFVPLAPSFLSYPFENLCWIPIIEPLTSKESEDSEKEEHPKYVMQEADRLHWETTERNILCAAHYLRLQHGIPGTSPPPPSFFHYNKPQKSPEILRTMITLARSWFVVWMGYLSYLITQALRHEYQVAIKPQHTYQPYPYWYKKLSEQSSLEGPWLDGLCSSSVLSFDWTTPCAGVILRLSKHDKSRPPIQFFFDHHIPVYYPWTMVEDEAVLLDRSLKAFEPPEALVRKALGSILKGSDAMMCMLLIQRYCNPHNADARKIFPLDWKQKPTVVRNIFYEYMSNEDMANEAQFPEILKRLESKVSAESSAKKEVAHLAANAPMREAIGWLDEMERGSLFANWKAFFDNRAKRNSEFLAIEREDMIEYFKICQKTPPPLEQSNIYQWKIIRSSRGKKLYLRLRVNKNNQLLMYHSYPKSQRVYDAITNEWNLCTGFKPPLELAQGDDMDDEVDYGDPKDLSDVDDSESSDMAPYFSEQLSQPSSHVDDSRQELEKPTIDSTPELFVVADTVRQTPKQDTILTLKYGYGYVPALPNVNATETSSESWKAVSRCFGFEVGGQDEQLSPTERQCIIKFFTALVKSDSQMLAELCDLNDTNHSSLSHLLDFSSIQRPSPNMFIFTKPFTTAVDWVLGVESPAIALYICRLALSNPRYTLLTIARHLLKECIAFRTLVPLRLSPDTQTLRAAYAATLFRKAGYEFSHHDFQASMIYSKAMVNQPRGRAALLKGGIISRIAREHTSLDGALEGPSIEVTEHHSGFVFHSVSDGSAYCDDEMTEDELAVICGTYSIYTEIKGQVTLKLWFPPPYVWSTFNGYNWLGWTERNERFFLDHLKEIENGGQPLSANAWKRILRGGKVNRELIDNNALQAKKFLDKHLPASACSINVKVKKPKFSVPIVISEDEFELVMGIFKKVMHDKTEYLHHSLETGMEFPAFSKYQDCAKFDTYTASLAQNARTIYPYWKERRLERRGHQIIPTVNGNESDTLNESYICFRRQESKAVLKTRASQVTSSDRLARLQAEFSYPLKLAKAILTTTRTPNHKSQVVWEKRLAFMDLKRKFPSLNDKIDEELLVNKEQSTKRADTGLTRSLCFFAYI
ncbi:Enhancer of polycomb-like protein 1 [Psilocybe cubensis]|uniref:Enhancer of polycomb-like protein 1 n=1 Tax=Psilocybe cubensis TaxID=181762 RepID=A0ACB8GUU1_PSICU|nr:Enhancer of polycomb-like protein 1 [Psilocybe cubensis]KAH9479207.1 Enhancer of polycomb-like protein 1 [Psilocybe cubensis]